MKQLKQLSGKYTNSYILIQLLPSEPLEPRLENGKRLHYNFLFGKLKSSKYVDVRNKVWYQDITGTYCASLINIVKVNYTRIFVARAYAKIEYENGEIKSIYSEQNEDLQTVTK